MQPQGPVGQQPQPEFTQKALKAKFSYSFTRAQLIILVNALRPIQLPISDMRAHILIEILGEIERTAIQSITASDYKSNTTIQSEKPLEATQPTGAKIQTN